MTRNILGKMLVHSINKWDPETLLTLRIKGTDFTYPLRSSFKKVFEFSIEGSFEIEIECFKSVSKIPVRRKWNKLLKQVKRILDKEINSLIKVKTQNNVTYLSYFKIYLPSN